MVLLLLLLKGGVVVAQVVDLETDFRRRLACTYTRELGVAEATGNNDGERVETYLRYTHLGAGYNWCAALSVGVTARLVG